MPFIITSVEEFAGMFPGVAHFYDGERFERFANGAIWDHENRTGFDPPHDEHDRDKRLVEYHQTLVYQAQAKFDQCDGWIRQTLEFASMNAGPLPPDSAIADRRKFRAQLIQAQTALDKARAKLDLDPTRIQQLEVARQRAEHRNRAKEILQSLNQGE